MYKNAEGYRDETAWRAIIAVAREERIKRRKLQEDKNMGTENKTGEVWRTRTVTGTETASCYRESSDCQAAGAYSR